MAIGFVASLVLTPLVRAVAIRIGDIDRPVGNKIHQWPTPRMGGVAIYLAFAVAALISLPLSPPVVGLLAGGFAATAIGFLDECFDLHPIVHFGGQIGAAAVAMVCGIGVLRSISVPTASLSTPGLTLPLAVGIVITLFWLVGMMNTLNFLDGLDGLAAGVGAIAALLLAAWASEKHPYIVSTLRHREDLILPLILAGALFGFLPYNLFRARIFLADSGSMFLGLALAGISIVGPTKLGTALLVLIIPVADVAWAIVRRQMRGKSFITGDKEHVYHRMLQLGMNRVAIVLLFYLLVGALAGLDLELHKVGKLVAFILIAIAISVSFILLEVRAARQVDTSATSPASVSPGKT